MKAEQLLCELPLEFREQLPDTKSVRPRRLPCSVATAAGATTPRRGCACNCPTATTSRSTRSIARRKQVVAHLEELVRQSGSTLRELCGLSTRSIAELPVEVGDVRRFTEGGFARFNGTAPLPRPPRAPASRSVTATTPAATGA
ncbi:MAG: hypothetical protein ACLP01_29060 [Solirubrobacteraceae bacterium]